MTKTRKKYLTLPSYLTKSVQSENLKFRKKTQNQENMEKYNK